MFQGVFKNEEAFAPHISGYKYRSVQAEIANLVQKGLDTGTPVFIEAPTGSGKSLAYLAPALMSNKRIIIATKTKALMEQLLTKDTVSMVNTLGLATKVVLLKGRNNYFCEERYRRLISSSGIYYSDVVEWFEANKDHIFEAPNHFSYDVRKMMTADSYQCKRSKCAYYDECPFYIARNNANDADVVITNHHLLLSDIIMQSDDDNHGTIFTPPDHIIFDEAHSLPDIYSSLYGANINLYAVVSMLDEHKGVIPISAMMDIKSTYGNLMDKIGDTKRSYDPHGNLVAEFMESCAKVVESLDDDDLSDEFNGYLEIFYNNFDSDNVDEEHIRSIEVARRSIIIKSTPLDISELFHNALTEYCTSPIFISATLSSVMGFDYFIRELGYQDETILQHTFPQIFNYQEQGLAYVPPELSLMDKNKLYRHIIRASGGSVLILCNSLQRTESVYSYLENHLDVDEDGEFELIYQSNVSSTGGKCVFIGTATLREGMDFSHSNLKCVIVDKLPFEYHKDLYTEAKLQSIEDAGNNGFSNYSLPRAVLFFKQSIGRLLRHENHSGGWVIADERLNTKQYGKHFKETLNGAEITHDYNKFSEFISRTQ